MTTITNLPAAVEGLREIVGRMTPATYVEVYLAEPNADVTGSFLLRSDELRTLCTALPIIDAQAARIAELEAEVARLREALARRDAVLGMTAYMGGNP